MKRTASPILMWAVIVRSQKSEWIHYETVHRLRREAYGKYEERHTPEIALRDFNSGRIRMARVAISLLQP